MPSAFVEERHQLLVLAGLGNLDIEVDVYANPVKHGLASAPELWPYSNFLEWIDQRSGTLVGRQFIGAHFETPARYQAFVDEYLSQRAMLLQGLLRLEQHLED